MHLISETGQVWVLLLVPAHRNQELLSSTSVLLRQLKSIGGEGQNQQGVHHNLGLSETHLLALDSHAADFSHEGVKDLQQFELQLSVFD